MPAPSETVVATERFGSLIRLAHIAFLVAIPVLLVWAWRELPAYVWATEYYQDDWEWVRRGSSLRSFLDYLLHPIGIVRPAFHVLYLLAYPFSELDARLLAVVLALAWWVTAFASVYMLRVAGFKLEVAAVAVAISAAVPATTQAFYQVSYHGLTVSRLLLVTTCIVFLRGNPQFRIWAPLLVVGFLTHEQYIATAPILLSLLCWRDGFGVVSARLRTSGALRSFCATFVALALIRAWMFYAHGEGGSHSLEWSSLPENLARLGRMLMSQPPGGVLFVLPLLLGATGIERRELATVASLCGAICVFGYAPFALQGSYFTPYFANLLVLGLGILLAWTAVSRVDNDLRSNNTKRTARALAVMTMTLLCIAIPPRLGQRPAPGVAAGMDEVLAPLLETVPRGRPVTIVFVEDSAPRQSAYPPYFAAIGLEQGRSSFFTLRWPFVEFEFERASSDELAEQNPSRCEIRVRVAAADRPTLWRIEISDHYGCTHAISFYRALPGRAGVRRSASLGPTSPSGHQRSRVARRVSRSQD